MPELPEVETVRAGLEPRLVGRRITEARVLHPRASRRFPGSPEALSQALAGSPVTAVARRGKYLWWELGERALVVHLGMSGQLLVDRLGTVGQLSAGAPATMVHPVSLADRHVRAVFTFDDGTRVRFVDQRTFGHLLLSDMMPTPDGAPGGLGSALAAVPEPVAHIARDLLDPALDLRAAVARVRASGSEIKRVLLDQTVVAGVGNIYADEALWRASVHPRRIAARLPAPKVREMLEAATAVFRDALAAGGTSFDALYVDAEGAPGYFARSLAAYGRAGEPCLRCGRLLVSERFTNRRSTYCPSCQRPGRPAAAVRRPS